MKLINVTRDGGYLVIVTDEGNRKQSLKWSGVKELEKKAIALIGSEIETTVSGNWDPLVWFATVNRINEPGADKSPPYSIKNHSQVTEVEKGRKFHLTGEQEKAIQLFHNNDVLKVNAFAGTGKTSTLIEMAKSTPLRGLYLAFNKSIAEEIAIKHNNKKLNSRTTHSLALGSIRGIYNFDSDKLFSSMQGNRIVHDLDLHEMIIANKVLLSARSVGYLVGSTIQRFCQSSDAEVSSKHVPVTGKLAVIDKELTNEFRTYVSQLAAHLWGRMTDPTDPTPLGHDGYLKLWSMHKPEIPFDYVLLDEAQDTNDAVLSVLKNQKCKVVYVGDRHQQIYEWRGAINAMDQIGNVASSALTKSFRFGSDIATVANKILFYLDEKSKISGNEKITSQINVGKARTIISRTNAVVLETVINSLRLGQTPHIVGGTTDIVRMLEDVTRLKDGTPSMTSEFFGFTSWLEVNQFSETEEGEHLKSFVNLVENYTEQHLISSLKRTCLSESDADLIACTAHKSKGREWDSVELSSDFVKTIVDPARPLNNSEETRLLYVAATRAKTNLILPDEVSKILGYKPATTTLPKPSNSKESTATSSFSPVARPPMPKTPSFVKHVSK